MRIKSLSVLLLVAACAAKADVALLSGKVYDVGKLYCSADSDVTAAERDKWKETSDSELCWAASAANIFQHWQDANPGKVAEGTPNGIVESPYTQPSGTAYLDIYNTFRQIDPSNPNVPGYDIIHDSKLNTAFSGWTMKNQSGHLLKAAAWYFGVYYGKTVGSNAYLDVTLAPGRNQMDVLFLMNRNNPGAAIYADLEGFQAALDGGFAAGNAVCLAATGKKASGTGIGHAITCWGYETDENGICALYITDSDDGIFGARRVRVWQEGAEIRFASDNSHESYGDGGTYKVAQVSYLSGSMAQTGDSDMGMAAGTTSIDRTVDLSRMEGKAFVSPQGLETRAGSILSASSTGSTLLLGGGDGQVEGSGLVSLAGSLVSLNGTDVAVSGFSGDGIAVGSEMYLNKGSVAVKDNGCVGLHVAGTADDPKAFLKVSGNSSVELSGNKHGAVRSEDNLMITHNGQVVISGNGDDDRCVSNGRGVVCNAETAGVMEIAHNDSVVFSGNKADYDIYNKGSLKVSADKGQSITFEHGIKNSASAVATIGMAGGAEGEGLGTYVFNGAAKATMTTALTTLDSCGEILVQGNGVLSIAHATMQDTAIVLTRGRLAMNDVSILGNLTVDFGNYALKNSLTMTSVISKVASTLSLIIDLNAARLVQAVGILSLGGENELSPTTIYLTDYIGTDADLSAFSDVSLTLAGRLEGDAPLIIDTGSYTGIQTTVLNYDYDAATSTYKAKPTPEPTTATLSLLALAGFCARRRRMAA